MWVRPINVKGFKIYRLRKKTVGRRKEERRKEGGGKRRGVGRGERGQWRKWEGKGVKISTVSPVLIAICPCLRAVGSRRHLQFAR